MKKTVNNFKKVDELVLKNTNGGSIGDIVAGFVYEMLPPKVRKRY